MIWVELAQNVNDDHRRTGTVVANHCTVHLLPQVSTAGSSATADTSRYGFLAGGDLGTFGGRAGCSDTRICWHMLGRVILPVGIPLGEDESVTVQVGVDRSACRA